MWRAPCVFEHPTGRPSRECSDVLGASAKAVNNSKCMVNATRYEIAESRKDMDEMRACVRDSRQLLDASESRDDSPGSKRKGDQV